MGNSSDSNNFTLEEFIAGTNIDSQNLDNHQILLKAYKIYTMFKSNPNTYKEFKEEEEKNTIKRNIISNIDQEEEKDNLNPKGVSLSNYRRFQLILCNAFLRTYDDYYIYIILIKIFKYIINEKDLFRLFIKNCIEQLCTLINNLEIPVDVITQIEGIELLIMILNLFKENIKLIKGNLQSISKILQICKKIIEIKIRNDLQLNIYFIKLIHECIEFLYFIQEQIKYDLSKDFSNFLLQQLSEFHSNGIFYNLVNSIDNDLIKKIIEKYYLEKEINLIDEFKEIMKTDKNNSKKISVEEEKILKEKKFIHDKINEENNEKREEYKKNLNKKIHDNNFFKKEDYKETYIFDDTYPFLIIKIFKILLRINITYEEKFIQPNEEIEKLINFILFNEDNLISSPFMKNENNKDDNNNTSNTTNNSSNILNTETENEEFTKQESENEKKLNILFYYFVNEFSCNILSFVIHFNLNYCLNTYFKDDIIFLPNFNPFLEKKFREKILKFYRLYINNDYIHLKFLISILFFELSITKESFKIFNELNLISSPHTLILLYVQETFNPNIIDFKSEEYKKRLKNILKFIETAIFISEDKIFNTIKHTELFSIYIDIISLLFYINNPIFRGDMIIILNKFTLYSDVKRFFLERKNHCIIEMILKRMDELFIDLKKSNKLAEDIEIQKKELNDNIEKESDDNKYKLIENLSLLENLTNHTKQGFVMACTEFGYLISIFVNLIMNNQFEINLKLLIGNKIEEYFLFDEDLINFKKNFLSDDLNETTTTDEKDVYIGKLLYYHVFFQKLKSLKQEINKPGIKNKSLSKFTFQLPLAELMFNPTIQIVFTKNEGDYFSETKGDIFNINSLIELIKSNLNDYQILHKLLFTTSRFFCKQNNFKEIVDNLKKLLEILNNLLLKNNELPLFLSREIFRLFCILSTGNNNCFLWMKFQNDINTVTFDTTNNNDIMLKYNDENLNWNFNEEKANIFENAYNNSFNNQSLTMKDIEKVKRFMSAKKMSFRNSSLFLNRRISALNRASNKNINNSKTLNLLKSRFEFTKKNSFFNNSNINENDNNELNENLNSQNARIKILPYFKVKPFNDKMGIITFDKHHFILPKPISLIKEKDSSFTIWFRFYNPVINTKKWHTLLQDETGLISLVCINDKGDRLGCFNKNGDFIDSGLNLSDKNLQNQWIQIAIGLKSLGTADGTSANGEIKFYLNGKAVLNKITIYKNENNNIKEYYSNKCVFPDNIQFIGNSRDYNEPFGVFCDLRIYKEFKESDSIKKLYEYDEIDKKNLILDYVDVIKLLYEKVSENSINYCLNTKTLNHEVLLFIVKFFNVLMNNSLYRGKFINFRLVMKIIEEGFSYNEREELKKELCKYLQILG